MPENYYEILGVSADATKEEIKASYRKLVRKFHPDISREDDAEERFKKINAATEILLDDIERLKYDSLLGLGIRRQRTDSKRSEQERQSGQEFFKENLNGNFKGKTESKKDPKKGSEPEGAFSRMFHGFFDFDEKPKKTQQNTYKKPEKINGEDIHTNITITSEEALCGTSRKLNIVHSETCSKCQGRKFINGTRCTLCDGIGEKSVHKKLSIKIPPNVKQGAKIRIANEGKAGRDGGKNGDLYLDINIGKTNDIFETQGNDTTCSIPIAPWEAVLGANIQVPAPSGNVTMKIPPATLSGQRFRLVGNGVKNSKTGKNGDLIVTVNIEIPKRLTPQELELYEKLKILDTRDIRRELFEEGVN